ncbi:MAG: DUF4446 family protein [Clostridiaceae bacterium]|nr:DUF4446 family protein [Clostridiaceae bacterium]
MGEYILYVSFVLAVLAVILLLVQNFRLNSMIKKYNKFMYGLGDNDVEKLMDSYLDELEKLKMHIYSDTQKRLEELEKKMQHCIQHVGIVNYNAFDNVGNDMSFSIAAMDEKKNGFILTGIYSRDHSYVYSKEIRKGKPLKELSVEELEAFNKAQNKFVSLRQ